MPPRDIYLVRHAESEWNAIGLWQGQADPPLSKRGLAQAQACADGFPLAEVSAIVSSDLIRARTTAEPLAARYGVILEIDQGLRELDVGSWSGKSRAQIATEDPTALDEWYRGIAGWEGGETYEEHEARAADVARGLNARDDSAVVVVTHGGTIRAIVLALLDLDPSLRWRFGGQDHVAVTHLEYERHGYRLVTYNSRAHLASGSGNNFVR